MQQRQSNPLNRSRLPDRRAQVVPGPVVQASGDEITDLQDAVTTLNIAVTALQGQFDGLGDYADDAAAAAGGVLVGDLYRNGSVLMIRVA